MLRICAMCDSETVLRAASDGDAAAVAELLMASRHAFLPYAPMAHSPSDIHRWVQHTLIPGGGVTLACVGENIAGVLAVAQEEGIAWIDQLYLLPAFVGQGLGTRLLQHALDALPRPVRLYTFQANAAARRFYERHGFVAIALTDGSTNEERCPDVLYEWAATP